MNKLAKKRNKALPSYLIVFFLLTMIISIVAISTMEISEELKEKEPLSMYKEQSSHPKVSYQILTQKIGFFNDSGEDSEVFVKDDYAFIADADEGLEIIDISEPENPTEIGQYSCTNALGVWGIDNYVYVAAGGLHIIDISDPENPNCLGILSESQYGSARDVIVRDNYAFVAYGKGGWNIIDVSDPTNPYSVWESPYKYYMYNEAGIVEIALDTELAFIAEGTNGLEIFNISDPTSPSEIGHLHLSNHDPLIRNIFIQNDVAVINLEYEDLGNEPYAKLVIANISNPTDPNIIGNFNFGENCYLKGLFVSENHAFIGLETVGNTGWRRGTLKIIDISDPTNPTDVGNFNNPRIPGQIGSTYGIITGICVKGNFTYITYWEDMAILKYSLDSDEDGLSDYDEINRYSTDPNNMDSDADDLPDYDEINKYSTDPNNKDTDNDGLGDAEEVLEFATDPLSLDTDNDGLTDWEEIFETNTNPSKTDSDYDGFSDEKDPSPNNFLNPTGIIIIVLGIASFGYYKISSYRTKAGKDIDDSKFSNLYKEAINLWKTNKLGDAIKLFSKIEIIAKQSKTKRRIYKNIEKYKEKIKKLQKEKNSEINALIERAHTSLLKQQYSNTLHLFKDIIKIANKYGLTKIEKKIEEKINSIDVMQQLIDHFENNESIEIDQMASLLGISRKEFIKKILAWDDFGSYFQISEDTIYLIDNTNTDAFIDMLDEEFRVWKNNEISKTGKKT